MKEFHIRKFLKTWMLPISMIGGIIFHEIIGYLEFLTPYLIFLMLTITYTRVNTSEFRITRFQWNLLLVQMLGSWLAYFALLPFSEPVATAAFICVFMPTATAAPVVTGMLGGSVTKLATYSLLSNLTVAVTAPVFLSIVNDSGRNIPFSDSFTTICAQVVPLLVLPLVVAILMRHSSPRLHRSISGHQSISFWLWAVALFIVMGRAVSFMIRQPLSELPVMIGMALASLAVCCLQFIIGRKVGARLGDRISGAQGLGQKNTILDIWMALTYLHPLVSIGPAAYIVWQNTINSYQLYRKAKSQQS